MKYLLDTEVVSKIYDVPSSENREMLSHKITSLKEEDEVYISVLTLYELEFGYEKAPQTQKEGLRKKITEIKSDFPVLPLPQEGAFPFAQLKKKLVDSRDLKKEPAKKYNIDLMLASTAMNESCILVSADRIYPYLTVLEPRFLLENWVEL